MILGLNNTQTWFALIAMAIVASETVNEIGRTIRAFSRKKQGRIEQGILDKERRDNANE